MTPGSLAASAAPTTDPTPPRPAPRRAFGFPLWGLLLPLALAVLWEVAVAAGWASGRLLPPPSRVAATLVDLWQTADLAGHILATLWRVLVGFAIGAVAGTLVGALTGASPFARRLLDPTVQGLRAIPSIAWVPLFILWLGIFEASKVALIAIGVFFPVQLGVAGAVASIDRKLVEVGRMFGLSRVALVRRVMLPAVIPAWITSLRAGLGLGFMFVVAAEFMGASEGLGYLLVDGQQLGKADQIVAAILVFAVLGQLADLVLVTVTRPFIRFLDTDRGAL